MVLLHAPQMLSSYLVCKLFHVHIRDKYVCIYASYELSTFNSETRCTSLHTFYIIGICPWTHMPVILQMYVPMHCYQSLHKDPTLLYIQVKSQLNATFTYNAIAIYVPAINTALQCHMCQLANAQIWHNYVSIYNPYRRNAVHNVTRSTSVNIYPLLGNTPEQ